MHQRLYASKPDFMRAPNHAYASMVKIGHDCMSHSGKVSALRAKRIQDEFHYGAQVRYLPQLDSDDLSAQPHDAHCLHALLQRFGLALVEDKLQQRRREQHARDGVVPKEFEQPKSTRQGRGMGGWGEGGWTREAVTREGETHHDRTTKFEPCGCRSRNAQVLSVKNLRQRESLGENPDIGKREATLLWRAFCSRQIPYEKQIEELVPHFARDASPAPGGIVDVIIGDDVERHSDPSRRLRASKQGPQEFPHEKHVTSFPISFRVGEVDEPMVVRVNRAAVWAADTLGGTRRPRTVNRDRFGKSKHATNTVVSASYGGDQKDGGVRPCDIFSSGTRRNGGRVTPEAVA